MSKRPLVYWNIWGEGARKASNAKIKNQRIFFSGRKIYQRIIMVMRIPVINLSSLRKQSGAEIESMIEHLEMREYFDMSFRGLGGESESKLCRSFDEECRYVGL